MAQPAVRLIVGTCARHARLEGVSTADCRSAWISSTIATPGIQEREESPGVPRRDSTRPFTRHCVNQDVIAFLLEVMIVGQNVANALRVHCVH